jgi:hypothetical protein
MSDEYIKLREGGGGEGTSYRVQVTGYKLQGTSYRVQVTGYKLQGTSYKLQVTGYRL